MHVSIKVNSELEGFDIIDEESDQSHDGDGAKEVIATVYDRDWADRLKKLLSEVNFLR